MPYSKGTSGKSASGKTKPAVKAVKGKSGTIKLKSNTAKGKAGKK